MTGARPTAATLIAAIAELEEDEVVRVVQAMLDGGEPPRDVLEAAKQGLAEIGRRYDARDYFLPELIIAGDMMKAIAGLVKPHLVEQGEETARRGRVVIGTVAGDIHDIGKDIVIFMLDVNGFEIVDLGVDVPAGTFVEQVRATQPQVVALSGFLTLAFDQMKATVAALREAGLRDGVKVMIGGAIMGPEVCAYVGADAYGNDAQAAVRLATAWTAAA